MQEPTSKREKLGMTRTHLSVPPGFEKKMNDRIVLGTMLVHKVHLEDPTHILYQDGNSQCSTTSRRVDVEYPTQVILHIYKSPLKLGKSILR